MWHLVPTRLRRVLLPALFAALAFSAGAAVATFAAQPPTIYYACVNTNNGNIRMIYPNGSCRNNETKIDWNQQGPAGPAGPQGPPGPSGGSGNGPTGTIVGDIGTWDSSTGPITPVAGVKVYVSGTTAITFTDSAGHFELSGVPLGVWSVMTASVNQIETTVAHCTGVIAEVQDTQADQTVEIPYIARHASFCSGIRAR